MEDKKQSLFGDVANTAGADDEEEQVDENYNPEEEVVDGNWKVVDLPQVTPINLDDIADTLWECKMKLYRFDKTKQGGHEWKERAVGIFKFIKDKKDEKIRGLLRQDTTNKIMANFYVYGDEKVCNPSVLPTHDKSWVWLCVDYSDIDVAVRPTRFCARFTKQEHIEQFKTEMLKHKEHNLKIFGAEKKAEEKKAEEA